LLSSAGLRAPAWVYIALLGAPVLLIIVMFVAILRLRHSKFLATIDPPRPIDKYALTVK
jgi:hypothetical protein